VTPLRPAGTAEFDGRRVDVLTDGEFIEAGATVRARAWRGGHLLVAAESGKEGAA